MLAVHAVHAVPAPRRPVPWAWLATALLGCTLLLLLCLVVERGVRAGAARNADLAAQADATWRCQLGRDRAGRQDCVLRAREVALAPR